MKISWTNDIHMGFLDANQEAKFLKKLKECKGDVLLIGGDISDARKFKGYLSKMSDFSKPVYFVLGNHDYYKGSISEVRGSMKSFLSLTPNLHWLNESGVVKLTDKVALIGHDGWADGRYGLYDLSHVELNDFEYIRELKTYSKAERLYKMQKLADEAAQHFTNLLPETAWAKHIVVLTHVPPWKEGAWHMDSYSDDYHLPFFSSKVVGDVLTGYMQEHPEQKMTVLCGHTHGGGKAQILPNLLCLTGKAEYYKPKLQRILTV
jgi:predicted MPP superfamily phosphohydrolase